MTVVIENDGTISRLPDEDEKDRLRAEIDRLTADRQLEKDIDLPAGVLTLKREYEQLTAALAEKEGEIERLRPPESRPKGADGSV